MKKIETELRARLAVLRQCSYFSGLPDAALLPLTQGMSLAYFERGEVLFWQDEPCAGLHIIQQGSVKLFKLSPRGRELIVKVFEDGDTFNEVPVFDGGRNPVNAAALEESDIWVIDPEVIRQAMRDNPEMCQAVVLNLAQNLRMLVGVVEELSFYQVTHRLARLISQLPPEQLLGQASLRLTQDQLAARLGTVREVVARSLRELERSGAIRVERGQIRIVDPRLLQGWTQGPSWQ
jgi:CRP/FNR family transcriptional regulator